MHHRLANIYEKSGYKSGYGRVYKSIFPLKVMAYILATPITGASEPRKGARPMRPAVTGLSAAPGGPTR